MPSALGNVIQLHLFNTQDMDVDEEPDYKQENRLAYCGMAVKTSGEIRRSGPQYSVLYYLCRYSQNS